MTHPSSVSIRDRLIAEGLIRPQRASSGLDPTPHSPVIGKPVLRIDTAGKDAAGKRVELG